MTTAETLCRDCGAPSPGGRPRCSACLAELRRSVDYRAATLERDGGHCAKCPQWWNRLALNTLGAPEGCPPRCPDHDCGQVHAGLRLLTARGRRVDVDHIDPLAVGGAQDPTNWQVLCKRHHGRKTRFDLAGMGLRRMPRSVRRPLVALVGVLLVASWLQSGPTLGQRALLVAASLVALGGFAMLVRRRRQRVLTRLWEALAVVIGGSNAARRPIRKVRWTLGQLLRGGTPASFELRYPHTLDDSDPDVQAKIERRVAAKLGGTWIAEWNTTKDRVVFRSPDPLADPTPIPWTPPVPGTSLWKPICLGIDDRGRNVLVRLVGKHLLIGGEPGGGKSVSLSELVPAACADPDVTVHLADGKRVEFAKYAPCAASVVHTQPHFKELLTELIATMDLRYEMLLEEGREQVEEGDGYGLHVLFIDELAFFVTGGKKTERDAIVELLRDLIQRGRAAGIIVVAATQRPSADVIPTSIRDLFGYRWALRCSTPASSDMVLGAGWASQGFSAAKVDAAMRGVGLLLHEGGKPVRLRTFLPEREQLLASVEAGAQLRAPKRAA